MDKETVRPSGTGHGREPPIAHSEFLGQTSYDWKLGGREALHDRLGVLAFILGEI
jgi:hypothetical protein